MRGKGTKHYFEKTERN